MKKLLLLLLLPFSLFGQTTYQLNYDSIRVNKTTGTGGTSLYGKVYLKNVGLGLQSDSILTVKNGRIRKVPVTETGGGGGGSSVSYYLNGSVNQGTFVGNVYREMNRTPIIGAGTDFTIATNGYITQFITDANDPNSLLIPAGNWNFETYFSASSGGGSPSFYVELYKYNGTTFTLIASNSATPELISFGTSIQPYFSSLAVPETVLLATDRLAVRFYVANSGRTITLHTENGHLSQIVTTFTTGLQALNGLTKQTQYFAVGTSDPDFFISSTTDTHTFNLPSASTTARGLITTGAQIFLGLKTFNTTSASAGFNLNKTTNDVGLFNFQVAGVDKSYIEWNINDPGSGIGTAFNIRNGQGAVGIYDNTNTGLKIASGSGVFAGSSTANAFIPNNSTIPTNGMYLSAANTLDFATNSTNRLSMSSTGVSTFSKNVTVKSGNGDQLLLDNAGQQFTQMDYYNNGSPKAATYWDNTNNWFQIITTPASSKIRVVAQTNGVELANGGTSWSSLSDIRQKTIIKPIDNALSIMKDYRTVIGRYNNDSEHVERSFLIAQDVQKTYPYAVTVEQDENNTLRLAYTELIPLLVKAIQELEAKIKILETKP